MQIILFGAPGAGKGTQAKLLSNYYDLPILSTGEMFRSISQDDSVLGRKVKNIIESGQLVSDEIVFEIITAKIRSTKNNQFILDGFPRTIEQIQYLLSLKEIESKNLFFFNIVVEVAELIKRLSGRFVCQNCKELYNKFYHPPKIDNTCDICQGNLENRADDKLEVVKKRLEVYKIQTSPLFDYCQNFPNFKEYCGSNEAQTIFEEMKSFLQQF